SQGCLGDQRNERHDGKPLQRHSRKILPASATTSIAKEILYFSHSRKPSLYAPTERLIGSSTTKERVNACRAGTFCRHLSREQIGKTPGRGQQCTSGPQWNRPTLRLRSAER